MLEIFWQSLQLEHLLCIHHLYSLTTQPVSQARSNCSNEQANGWLSWRQVSCILAQYLFTGLWVHVSEVPCRVTARHTALLLTRQPTGCRITASVTSGKETSSQPSVCPHPHLLGFHSPDFACISRKQPQAWRHRSACLQEGGERDISRRQSSADVVSLQHAAKSIQFVTKQVLLLVGSESMGKKILGLLGKCLGMIFFFWISGRAFGDRPKKVWQLEVTVPLFQIPSSRQHQPENSLQPSLPCPFSTKTPVAQLASEQRELPGSLISRQTLIKV